MPDWPVLTDRVIFFAVVSLLLYNVVAGVMGGGTATISARLQHHAVRYPVIPFAIGMLAGHWVWPVFGVRE
jgi:hypothetical protein